MPVTDDMGRRCEILHQRRATRLSRTRCVQGRLRLRNGDGAMIKIFYAVSVSAIAAACFVVFPTLSEQVHANPPAQIAQAGHSEIHPAVATCGQNAWPYLDTVCGTRARRWCSPAKSGWCPLIVLRVRRAAKRGPQRVLPVFAVPVLAEGAVPTFRQILFRA
jgi:hypothetical protein